MAIDNQTLSAIVSDSMLHNRSFDALGWLCDHVGGRIAGTEAGKRAEDWAADFLKSIGLKPWFEPFPVLAWERVSLDVTALGPTPWKLAALAHGNTGESADVEAEVLDVAFGERGDFERLQEQIGGKVVLCVEGVAEGHRPLHRSEKLALAVEFGASGLMILSSAPGNLPRTGMCADKPAPIPSLGISLEDGQRILRLLNAGTSLKVRISMRNRLTPSEARNVLADIPGTQNPHELVLAGGHLDSWDPAQGACDNGLGSAIVLDIARVLSSLGQKPKRTLRFALWAAEEVGLCGSSQYVKAHASELDDLHGVLNFDMTGEPFGYWSPGFSESPELLKQLAKQMDGLGMTDRFDGKAGLHSDHQPFMLAGVPTIALMARLEGGGGHYYHAVGDTFDKIDKPGLCKAVAVGATTLWAVANAPERVLTRRSHQEVVDMVTKADLLEALAVENWHP